MFSLDGHAMASEDERRLELLEHELGPEIKTALHDPDVVEISLNDDGRLWLQRHGRAMEPVGSMDANRGYTIVSLVADSLGQVVTYEQAIVEGELPLPGYPRFEGVIPPVVRAPVFSIRKHCGRTIPLPEYVRNKIMPESVYGLIQEAVRHKKNILVAGGTGSGKTTLVNGIIAEMNQLCPQERLLILEDTRELKSTSPNTVYLRSTLFTPMSRLVKATLRLRPDRIIVGEVRDQCALDMLMAWNTGHPGGVCTTHSNLGAEDALTRLEQLILMSGCPHPMQALVGSAVDVILHIGACRGERKVLRAVRVHGYETRKRAYQLETLYAYEEEDI